MTQEAVMSLGQSLVNLLAVWLLTSVFPSLAIRCSLEVPVPVLPFAGGGSIRVEGAAPCYGRELFILFVRAECLHLEAAE